MIGVMPEASKIGHRSGLHDQISTQPARNWRVAVHGLMIARQIKMVQEQRPSCCTCQQLPRLQPRPLVLVRRDILVGVFPRHGIPRLDLKPQFGHRTAERTPNQRSASSSVIDSSTAKTALVGARNKARVKLMSKPLYLRVADEQAERRNRKADQELDKLDQPDAGRAGEA